MTDAAPKAAATEPVRKTKRVWPVRRGGLCALPTAPKSRVEYWQGNTFRGWNVRLLSDPETNETGRTVQGSFDHIRVPEDFQGDLPEGFEWAGSATCAWFLTSSKCPGPGTRDITKETCPNWKPRGAA